MCEDWRPECIECYYVAVIMVQIENSTLNKPPVI